MTTLLSGGGEHKRFVLKMNITTFSTKKRKRICSFKLRTIETVIIPNSLLYKNHTFGSSIAGLHIFSLCVPLADLEDAVVDREERDIECAATQIVDLCLFQLSTDHRDITIPNRRDRWSCC